ncbi:hypothetical protein WDZ92_47740, partial [Nostoc sp. NIES-2111]
MSARTPWSVVANLNVGSKITILLALVGIPFALLLWLFVDSQQQDIRFAQQELVGTAALRAMIPSALAVADHGAAGDNAGAQATRPMPAIPPELGRPTALSPAPPPLGLAPNGPKAS